MHDAYWWQLTQNLNFIPLGIFWFLFNFLFFILLPGCLYPKGSLLIIWLKRWPDWLRAIAEPVESLWMVKKRLMTVWDFCFVIYSVDANLRTDFFSWVFVPLDSRSSSRCAALACSLPKVCLAYSCSECIVIVVIGQVVTSLGVIRWEVVLILRHWSPLRSI